MNENAQPFGDTFFSPLENTKPYLKINFFGFAGTGKTYTAALTIVGMYKKIGSTKPIVIFDTESASKFLKPLFEKHGIKAVVKESRSLADLKETMKRCREGYADFLLIDSISHIWENFLESYKAKKNRSTLQFQDWGVIKPTWRMEFSDPFVRDPYHIIMTGRAGNEYDNEMNPDTNKREIYKSGIKQKVEGETAYEPDILVLMERYENVIGDNKEVWREGTVLKDRAIILDGKTLKNPTYESFAPSIEVILANPVKRQEVAEMDAADLVKTEDDKREYLKRRDIILEKIEAYLTTVWPSQAAEAKAHKIKALEFAFGSPSWTEIKGKNPSELEGDFEKLHEYVELVKKEKELEDATATAEKELAAKAKAAIKTPAKPATKK